MSHDHSHEPVTTAAELPAAARVRALTDLLVEKGVVERDEIRRPAADAAGAAGDSRR